MPDLTPSASAPSASPASSDRIIPELDEQMLAALKAEHGHIYVLSAVVGDTPEESEHVVYKRPPGVVVKRIQRLVGEEKEEAAISSAWADLVVWPAKPVLEKLVEEYPLVPRKLFVDALRIAQGDQPARSKKA